MSKYSNLENRVMDLIQLEKCTSDVTHRDSKGLQLIALLFREIVGREDSTVVQFCEHRVATISGVVITPYDKLFAPSFAQIIADHTENTVTAFGGHRGA